MRYLVLGSEGQIGKHLCRVLESTSNEVLRFDINLETNHDLRTPNNTRLDNLMSRCDAVFFLAFDCGGAKYLSEHQFTKQFIDNNLQIMMNAFDAINRHQKPFLFASSQMSRNIDSSYGTLKAIGEHYARSLNGITAKLWNVYGKEDINQRSHVITDFVKSARDNKHIKMMTDGKEERQFLHADDCSRAMQILIERYNQTAGFEYHITSFEWTSIHSIALMISSLVDDCKITKGSAADNLQNGFRLEPKIDILSLWKPQITLLDGIKEMLYYEFPTNKIR